MKYTISEIWNNGTRKQRERLLFEIYHNPGMYYLCDKEWDMLPYGIQRRIEIVAKVCGI
jgi:hypothetical protein